MVAHFVGKTALITGAASGMGRATAKAFAAEGATVILLDVNRPALKDVLAEIGGKGTIAAVDLRDPDATEQTARSAITQAGGVDVLVNAAGWSTTGDTVMAMAPSHWADLVMVNMISGALLVRIAAEDMIARKVSGRIVNVASSSAFRAQFVPAGYAAAKAGVMAFTRAAAAELGLHDINVNAIVPGVTLTPMLPWQDAETIRSMVTTGPTANLLHRASEAEDVANVILFLCRPESRQITGQGIHVSAGAVV